jgi:hypothetical protein
MVLVSAETVRRRLRRLTDGRFVAFVGALWSARGAEVGETETDGTVEIRHDQRTETLQVVTGRRLPTDVDPTATLVLARPASSVSGTDDHTGRVVDADDIHSMLLYAVSRDEADDLCRRFFDRPLAVADATPGRSVTARVPEYSAPLVVGLLGIVLVVAGVFGGPALYGDDDVAVFGAPDSSGDDVARVGTDDSPPTRTPAGTESPSFDSTELPPGLGPDGVVDEELLADRHAKAVTGQSYRWTITHREFVDGQPTAYRRETVYVASPTEYRTEIEGAGDLRGADLVISGIEAYADGEARYERRFSDGSINAGTGYGLDRGGLRGVQNGEGRYADRAERYIGWYLSVSESAVVDTFERAETRYYWVRLGRDPYPGVENSTGSALVDENGVVHEIRRQYDVPGDGDVSAVVTLRYTDFGTTTVQPPPWHDRGIDAGNETATTPTSGQSGTPGQPTAPTSGQPTTTVTASPDPGTAGADRDDG